MKKLLKSVGASIGYIAVYLVTTFAVVIAAALVVGIYAGIQAVRTGQFQPDTMDRIYENSPLLMIISGIFSMFFYWLILRIRKVPVRERLDLIPVSFRRSWPVIPLGICLNLLITYAINLIPISESVLSEYGESVSQLNMMTLPGLIMAVVMAPVVEEVLLRGLVFKSLLKSMPFAVALVLQAIAFGLMHGQILWMAYATLLGIVLGLVKKWYKSLFVCMMLHFSLNASNYILDPVLLFVADKPALFHLLNITVIAGTVFLVRKMIQASKNLQEADSQCVTEA